ncbi:GNAT family N-acetyltransferase [Rhodovulum sp. DZ06]|uniref:GNAT family N-acetyltransferase n=1 Tax=Rhodovulum sp. DZ06 TaxID=3425126 RepID=UPI003D33C339
MITDPTRLFEALDATWPAAETSEDLAPGWRLRRGAGGGKRVSCATALVSGATPDIVPAEAAMREWGQVPLFMVRPGEDRLDDLLAARGYDIIDRTVIYAADAGPLADAPLKKGVRAVTVRTRLALLHEIWAEGGIGPERVAVMERCAGPKATIMARTDAATAGVAHVAVDGDVAMLHAAEVRREARRFGAGTALLAGAARFALDNGAGTLALAVTEANAGARALYERAGMTVAAQYRYRIAQG